MRGIAGGLCGLVYWRVIGLQCWVVGRFGLVSDVRT